MKNQLLLKLMLRRKQFNCAIKGDKETAKEIGLFLTDDVALALLAIEVQERLGIFDDRRPLLELLELLFENSDVILEILKFILPFIIMEKDG